MDSAAFALAWEYSLGRRKGINKDVLIKERIGSRETKAQRNHFFRHAKRLIVRTRGEVDDSALLRIEFAYCSRLAKRAVWETGAENTTQDLTDINAVSGDIRLEIARILYIKSQAGAKVTNFEFAFCKLFTTVSDLY